MLNSVSLRACLRPPSQPLLRSITMLFLPRPAHSLVVAAVLILVGCKEGDNLLLPSEGEPASIEVIRGDGQSGRVGDPLAEPLIVQVSDSRNRPVEGATVVFELTPANPGAELVPDTATTDANGEASARLVLGTTVGRQSGQAKVIMDSRTIAPTVSFTATAVSESASSMVAVAGQDQTGRVSAPLPERLVVQVTDGFGNPTEGVPITWEASGGGTVSEATTSTDDQGRASVQRVLGPAVGAQTTIASSEGLAGSPITFVHTALAGDASLLTIVSGDNQTGRVGSQLSADLVVRLVDGEGNGVPNTAVAWVAATGGATVDPQNSNTDDEGRASARLTLGTTPGANRVDAVVSGVGVVSFDAMATAAAPASLSILTQPSSSGRNGIRLDRQPVVQLRDGTGNPVAQAGVPVSAALGAGSGALSGTRQENTDANGRAVFTDLAINGSVGRYTLVFSSVGYASGTSSGVDLRAIPTGTSITRDDPDPSAVGAAFTVEFRVTSEGPSPIGSVTVGDGRESCSGVLQGGSGSCSLALNTPGSRTLTATYSGGPGFDRSSGTKPHQVEAATPPPPSNQPPSAGYQWQCQGVTCQFTDGSSDRDGSITGRTWNFGDGSAETSEANPAHTFPGSGNYTVALTVTDNAGASDVFSTSVAVQAPAANQPPTARFTFDCRDLSCRFNSAPTTDPDGRIVSRTWAFGDGGTSGDDPSPDHTYAAPGTYTVTLTVTDDDGATDTGAQQITVTAPPPTPNKVPKAAFTFSCAELTCSFIDGSSDPDGTIVSRSWAFGDGAASAETNPSHTYPSDGQFTVTLTVTDDKGAQESESREVKPKAPPPANQAPTAAFSSSCTALSCAFNSDGSSDPDGKIASRSWTFGDGASSNESNPSHAYGSAGTYTVALTVTDNNGASAQESHEVTVAPANQAPTAAIAGNCTELSCSFSSQSSSDPDGNIVSWSWTFGDGSGSSDANPSHSYSAGGKYTVTLMVTDDGGASDAVTQEFTVVEPPPPNQAPSASFSSDCHDLTCSFNSDGSSDVDGRIVSRSWDFGDGTTSSEANPSHTYAAEGTFTVILTVTDDQGTPASQSQGVTVTAPAPPS